MALEQAQTYLARFRDGLYRLVPGESLQAAALFWCTLGLLAAMAIFMVLAMRMASAGSERVLNERLALTSVAARNLDLVMQLVLEDLAQQSAHLTFDANEAITAEQERNMEAALQHLPAFNNHVFLLGPKGTIRWATLHDPASTGANMADRPFIQEALADPRPRISNLTYSLLGQPVVLATAPVTDSQGRFGGLLVGEIHLDSEAAEVFFPVVEVGATGYLQLLDGDGKVLMSSSSRADGSENYDLMGHIRRFVSERQPRGSKCFRCHQESDGIKREQETIVYYPLSSAAWGIMVRQSEEEAMAGVRELQLELALAGLAVLAVALLVIWAGTRRVFAPVHALSAAAAQISQGNFDVTVPRAGRNEVGKLAQGFEQMSVKVKALLEEERHLRENLEARVKDATKELASLCEVSQTVNRTSLRLQELLREVLAKAVDAIEGADAGMLLLDEQGKGLVVAASVGYDLARLSGVALKPGEGMAGQAFQQGAIVCNSHESILEWRNSFSRKNLLRLDRAAAASPPALSALAVPLTHGEETHGVLMLVSHSREGAFSSDHITLARSVADQVAVGVANARLYEELQRREAARSDLLRKLISAQEEERRRLARELHDEAGQALTMVMMSASRAEQALPQETEEARARMVEARTWASQALDEIRRLILDLRPQVLDHLGLEPALKWLVKNRLQGLSIQGRLDLSGMNGRLPGQVEVTAFRAVQEALTNVIRHSEASKVVIKVHLSDSTLSGVVEDDGKGFEVEKVLAPEVAREGFGLGGMEERISLLEGNFSVKSRPGHGTRISFQIPLARFQKEASDVGQDKSPGSGRPRDRTGRAALAAAGRGRHGDRRRGLYRA